MTIQPLTGTLGAEIHGMDLKQDLSNAEFDAVHQASLTIR